MSYDGPVSRLLNRRLSRPLARIAARHGISPNQATVLSTAVAASVPLLFSANAPRLAGLMTQAASVVDGVDGDLARLTGRTTEFGAVLDAVSDRYADIAVIAGMTSWSARHEGKPWTGMVGLCALAGSLMVSYSRARLEAQTGTSLSPEYRGVASRDVRLLVAAAGAMTRRVYYTLVMLAALTNLSVGLRLYRFHREQR